MEFFDIVDENGKPTGNRVGRKAAHRFGIRHRTAHIWIVRKNDFGQFEVLLQQRSAKKDSFPLQFDTSSAGHVRQGDEPLFSAIREIGEELGIQAEEADFTFIGTFLNKYEQVFHGELFMDNEISFTYICRKKVDLADLSLQEDEVACCRWFLLDEVIKRTKNNDSLFCTPLESLQLLQNYLCKKE